MTNLWPIYRRELKSFFSGPIAWLVIVVFLLVSAIFFILILNEYAKISFEVIRSNYQMRVEQLTVAEAMLSPLFRTLSFLLLLLMPVLTMKSFSEEKKSGTIELLFTWPISDTAMVLGKVLAAFTVFAVMLGLTSLYMVIIYYFKPLPIGFALTGMLGLLLMGLAYTSLGVFISSLTENQIISAVGSFGTIMFFWLIGAVAGDSSIPIAAFLRYLSIFEHFQSFAAGVIDTRDVVFYISFAVVFISATLRVLESRRFG